MLEIEELCVSQGAFRLDRVSLTVGAGECHALLGPSGAGKSTLLAALLGTLPLESGRLRLAGEEISHWPIERRRLGYLPQNLGLFPHLTVLDNLRYGARACRLPSAEFQPLLERLIEVTGIGALLQRRIATLSGGERQRVALVRALIIHPRLVLLDEPFTALNESLRRELWWLLKELQKERALTALIVTHDLAEAHFLADRMTLLFDGRVAQSGDKATLYRRPASLAAARFLGLKNLFPARIVAPGAADCPLLGGRLTVTDAQPADRAVWLAIRAEHVALRAPDDPPRPAEARLTGHFETVIDLNDAALLQFRAQTGARLEVHCGSRTLRRFGLRAGLPGVVGLPADDLFVIEA